MGELSLDMLSVGITFTDIPPADEDILQIVKTLFSQQRITGPGILCQIAPDGTCADLWLDIGERRRDELGDLRIIDLYDADDPVAAAFFSKIQTSDRSAQAKLGLALQECIG